MKHFDESVPKLLSTEQVAKILGIKPHTLAVARHDPSASNIQIPYIKIGRSVRYATKDLTAYLERQRRGD